MHDRECRKEQSNEICIFRHSELLGSVRVHSELLLEIHFRQDTGSREVAGNDDTVSNSQPVPDLAAIRNIR